MERLNREIDFSITPSVGVALLAVVRRGAEPQVTIIKPPKIKLPRPLPEVQHIIKHTPAHKTPPSGKR